MQRRMTKLTSTHTHLQIVEGPLLHLGVHWHQCFVVSSSPPGRRVHLPGLTHRHG